MKKLTVILLALAFTAALAVPAMSGELSVKGAMELDLESRSIDDAYDTTRYWIDDDTDITFTLKHGDVTFVWRAEVSDGTWQGHSNSYKTNIVDDFHLTWKVNDAMSFKAGEYALSFGRDGLSWYNRGGHNLGLMYNADFAKLALYYGKVVEDDLRAADPVTEAGPIGEDKDTNHYVLTADFGKPGPFNRMKLGYILEQDKLADTDASSMAIDAALGLGPVALALEAASNGGDNADGIYYLLEVGLEELVGFGLNLTYYMADEDYEKYFNTDYGATYLFDVQEDVTWLKVGADYGVTEKMTIGADAVVMSENDAGDDWGQAVDVWAKYKFADNITAKATYGTWTGSDVQDDQTGMRLRFNFTF